MRIMARSAGVLDGIMTCAECGGPMVKAGHEYRCMTKIEPEELVALGFIPSKNGEGKIEFKTTAVDQQSIQISQASSRSVELDNAYLQSLGLDLYKIRQYQVKHSLVP
jgi:hypothetical protein